MKALLSVLVLISVATPSVHAGVKARIAGSVLRASGTIDLAELTYDFNKALIKTRESARRAAQQRKRDIINKQAHGSDAYSSSAESILRGEIIDGSNFDLKVTGRAISATDDRTIFSHIAVTIDRKLLNDSTVNDVKKVLSSTGRRAETYREVIWENGIRREEATISVLIDHRNLDEANRILVNVKRALENGEIGSVIKPTLSRQSVKGSR